jgi:SAM-dependent methyltransferase
MNPLKHPRLRASLDDPWLFNSVRWLLAGRQDVTRRLLASHLALTTSGRVLDVCCGTGDFAMIAPGRYVGLDLNARFVDYARQRYAGQSEKSFLVADATCANFPPKSFDSALFLGSLHHFSDNQARVILGRVARATVGLVAITDLLADVPNPAKRLFAQLDRGDHLRSLQAKKSLLEGLFSVEVCQVFESRLAVQALLICRPTARSNHEAD